MATMEFKSAEARAFWCASSGLRQALRDGAPKCVIDALKLELDGHARYGISDKVRQRADALISLTRRAARAG